MTPQEVRSEIDRREEIIASLKSENARLTAELKEYSGWSPHQFTGLLEQHKQLGQKHIDLDSRRYELEVERDALATRCRELENALRHLKGEAYTNLDCNHPGRAEDEGSDYCDGEDCIHCHIIQTVDTALAVSEPSTTK